MPSLLKILFYTILLMAILWLSGLFYFIYTLPEQSTDKDLKTDAIVVWTGGGCRVATGLELLANGLSNRLFISGVYRDRETSAMDNSIINDQPPSSNPISNNENYKDWNTIKMFAKSCSDCQINLNIKQISFLLNRVYMGHQAKTTIGNAIETGEWVKKNKIHSIRLVTSPMHIPRSLIECKRYLPNHYIIIHPVELSKFNHHHWYKDWQIASKIALEYSKYLSILCGLRIQRQNNLYGEL